MGKDSVIIGVTSVLITTALIGGVYYMAVVRQPVATDEEQPTTWETLQPRNQQSVGDPNVSAETSSGRTSKPIKCHDEELGEFWTNATTCEGADLNNRISIAEPVLQNRDRDRYSNEDYESPEQQARNNSESQQKPVVSAKKPSLPLVGKSPPANLPPECKFPVGKALEIERALSAADDPEESIWREDYCKWRREARGCEVPGDLYYYRNLCGVL